MSKRRASQSSSEGCEGSAAQIEQLFSLVAELRSDFAMLQAYRRQTDADHTAATVEETRPPGNWQHVGEVMFLTGRCNSTIHKWIRRKKVRVHQPNGPRTAILIDIDNLPPGVSRSVNSAVDTPQADRSS